MRNKFVLFFIPILFSLFFSCASYSIDNFIQTGKTFSPFPESEEVDVVMRAVPSYKVIPIGLIKICYQVNLSEDGITELKKVARSKGGNVIALFESGYEAGYKYSIYEVARKVNN